MHRAWEEREREGKRGGEGREGKGREGKWSGVEQEGVNLTGAAFFDLQRNINK